MQVCAGIHRFAKCIRAVHLAAKDARVIRPEKIPLVILVDEHGTVDVVPHVPGDFAERAGGAFAFQHIMTKAGGRSVHVKGPVGIDDLRGERHQTRELVRPDHGAFGFPIYQV